MPQDGGLKVQNISENPFFKCATEWWFERRCKKLQLEKINMPSIRWFEKYRLFDFRRPIPAE